MTPSTKIQGLDEMLRDFRSLSNAVKKDKVMTALEAGARVIQIYAANYARTKLYRHPLGTLTNNLIIKREGNKILVGVFGVVYAKIHEFGGIITPRKGKYLWWKAEDGSWVHAKKVTIPARPYMRPAVDNHLSEIERQIKMALARLLKESI